MTDLSLFLKINSLPDYVKEQASDFIDFLWNKELIKKKKKKVHPKSGFLKGTFKISQDFDEPLDDFKEYS